MEIPNIWRDPTLAALDAIYEQKGNAGKPRDYIGASSIGDECSRKLWYRLAGHQEQFNADTLRRFEDGHRTEALVLSWLRILPNIELHTHDAAGKQYGFSALGDRFKGHYDGIIKGILQAPKTWHVLEIKCVNDKSFNEFEKLVAADEKNALQQWNPVYYAQAVTYMQFAQVTRHYMVVASSGGRRLASCRTNENPDYAMGLVAKAERILNAKQPPERIGKRDYYKCKMCAFKDMCHDAAS